MTDIRRFSSRRQRLDQAFLSQKLAGAKSYRRIAGSRQRTSQPFSDAVWRRQLLRQPPSWAR